MVPLSVLRESKDNPRKHPSKSIDEIAYSMQKYGFTNPILVDKDNTIIAGHGRYLAAKKLSIKEVPIIQLPIFGKEAKAYMVADNRIQEESAWDYLLLKELFDQYENKLDDFYFGFDKEEIENILNSSDNYFPINKDKEYDENIVTKQECPKCHYQW